MTYKEIERIVDTLKCIPDEGNREEIAKLLLPKLIEQESMETMAQAPVIMGEKKQASNVIFLEFTQKEISKIPMRFRKEFLIEGRVVHCQKRKCGKTTYNYMLRYRRNGYNLTASSTNLEDAKRKFIEVMQAADRGELAKKCKREENKVPTNFHKFATYYFETYRKRKVSEQTYENDGYRYKKHLQPEFGEQELRDITSIQCQRFLDFYERKGQTKTHKELYSMLNGIFKMAIAHNILTVNPMAIVIMVKHDGKHGKALTKAEEKTLLEGVKGTRYEAIMALALYTGLRPNEYYTAKIEGDFIVARNSKRKGNKIEYKKIPISVMLKPYIEKIANIDLPTLEYVRREFNKILPNHILYDLRTTFYTRCEECGVAPPARDHFVGHSSSALNSTYSNLSDEYLLNEGKRLVW